MPFMTDYTVQKTRVTWTISRAFQRAMEGAHRHSGASYARILDTICLPALLEAAPQDDGSRDRVLSMLDEEMEDSDEPL